MSSVGLLRDTRRVTTTWLWDVDRSFNPKSCPTRSCSRKLSNLTVQQTSINEWCTKQSKLKQRQLKTERLLYPRYNYSPRITQSFSLGARHSLLSAHSQTRSHCRCRRRRSPTGGLPATRDLSSYVVGLRTHLRPTNWEREGSQTLTQPYLYFFDV